MKITDVRPVPDLNEDDVRIRTVVLKPAIIDPLTAYYTLRNLFGPPNSNNFDDLKTQWCYHLEVPGALLEVYDWKLETWSVGVYEIEDNVERAYATGSEFVKLLSDNSARHAKSIKQAAKNATAYVIQNPFRLYYDSGEKLLERIDGNEFESADLCRAAFFMFIASFEGLVNLLYELYLKPNLRDERIYERISREQIDIKIRLAPLYCECFAAQSIDHKSEAFGRLHSVMNLRNDFIHANLTRPMKRSLLEEDGYTFMVEPDLRTGMGLPVSFEFLSFDDLQIVKNIVDDMANLLLSGMKPRFKREFGNVLEHDFVRVSLEGGEVVIEAVG